MENIAYYLANVVIDAYNKTDYASNLTPPLKIMNVIYHTNVQYVFRGLVAISGMLKVDCNDLGHEIMKYLNLDADYWFVNLDTNRKQIEFTMTNKNFNSNISNLLRYDQVIKKTDKKLRILVDFSSPNVAKDMHVGHLRSTIIGDSICRLLEIQGHEVHRINHIGDFGLQFGMLVQYIYDNYDIENIDNIQCSITDLQQFYTASKKCFDTDEQFKKMAYQRVVELQSGSDQKITKVWNFIRDVSRKAYNQIYDRLNIHLVELGESFYQKLIPNLIEELESKGLLEVESGRKIIRTKTIKEPLTVVKSDGGFTYDTTDLAAIRYRLVDMKMDNIYYVVDVGQSDHFKKIFSVAQMAGWLDENKNRIEHIGFGLVLGNDNKRFRTRDGGTVKLVDLLDEAILRTEEINNTKNRGFTQEETDKINKSIAYGAVKYADLSMTRTSDYVFSFDRMISLKGNTAPYLLYAYVRICAIIRNAGHYFDPSKTDNLDIKTSEEINLVKHIIRFPEIIDKLTNDMLFHSMSSYLYGISEFFNKFFTKCRCIQYKENGEILSVDQSRLLLCEATRKIMEQCFNILGIETLSRM